MRRAWPGCVLQSAWTWAGMNRRRSRSASWERSRPADMGMKAVLARGADEAREILEDGNIAVFIDPRADIKGQLQPNLLVDAVMAKRNLGTTIDDARVVVALGPGFEAGVDAHAVVETNRGH